MLRLDALIARLLLLYELIYPKLKQNISAMTCAILPRSYIVRTFQKPISVVVLALTAPVVVTVASFRLWPLSVIRILLPAEFLMFSLSAFTAAHGMDSGGSFCTDDSCKLHVAVSVTKAFYMTGLLTLCKTPKPGGPFILGQF